MGVGISIELSRRNSRYSNLMDEEPAKLKIPRTIAT
jgi:hypothetical protein